MNQTSRGFSFSLRAIALGVLIAFTTTTVAWGAPTEPSAPRLQTTDQRLETRILSLAEQITIPADIGSVKEVFQPQVSASSVSSLKSQVSGLVVHLEDAHGSVEAQLHQEEILRYLQKQYGLNTIFVEGGLGDLRPELLRFFKDSELNGKLMDKLTEGGLVGGVERYLATAPDQRPETRDHRQETKDPNASAPASSLKSPVRAFGVEDASLYRRELELFREVYDGKPASEKFLGEMRQSLLAQSAASFNKELKDFFREWLFQAEVQQETLSHLSFLQKYAKEALKLDLTDAREQYDWPQLVRFFKLKKLEKSGDSVQGIGDSEKQKLEAWLHQKGLSDFKRIFEGVLSKPSTLIPTSSGDIRSHMERFYEAAAPLGFKFETYPSLSKQIGKRILSQELQVGELMREMERLNEKILEVLAKTPEEKKGVAKYQEYLLLKKLLALELSRAEFEELSQGLETGDPRLEAKALGQKSPVSGLMSRAMEFYQVAEQRDEAIFKHMVAKMREIKQPNAVLITGGFHSEGLAKALKDSGLSFVRIAPRIAGKIDDSHYLQIMAGGLAPFSQEKVPVPLAASHARQPSLADGLPAIEAVSPAVAQFYRSELRRVIGEMTPKDGTPALEPATMAAQGLAVSSEKASVFPRAEVGSVETQGARRPMGAWSYNRIALEELYAKGRFTYVKQVAPQLEILAKAVERWIVENIFDEKDGASVLMNFKETPDFTDILTRLLFHASDNAVDAYFQKFEGEKAAPPLEMRVWATADQDTVTIGVENNGVAPSEAETSDEKKAARAKGKTRIGGGHEGLGIIAREARGELDPGAKVSLETLETGAGALLKFSLPRKALLKQWDLFRGTPEDREKLSLAHNRIITKSPEGIRRVSVRPGSTRSEMRRSLELGMWEAVEPPEGNGSVLPAVPVPDSLVASELIKVLGLEKARVVSKTTFRVDKEQGGESHLTHREMNVFRVRLPGSTSSQDFEEPYSTPLQDMMSALDNAVPGEADLLYNDRSQLIAIFPIPKNPGEPFRYYDLSDYYLPIEMLNQGVPEDVVFTPDTGFFADLRSDKRSIAKFKDYKQYVKESPSGENYLATPFENVGAKAYGYVRYDPLREDFEIDYFNPFEEGSDYGRYSVVSPVLHEISKKDGQKQIVFPVFPTVYAPMNAVVAYSDRFTFQTIAQQMKTFDFKDGGNVLDSATGSGLLLWMEYVIARARGLRLDYYAYDRNPIAVANAKILLERIAGIPVHLKVSGDIACFGEGVRFDFISADGPSRDLPGDDLEVSPSLIGLWDQGLAGNQYYHNLLTRLKGALAEGGMSVVWQPVFGIWEDREAMKILRSQGLRVRRLGASKRTTFGSYLITHENLIDEIRELFKSISKKFSRSELRSEGSLKDQGMRPEVSGSVRQSAPPATQSAGLSPRPLSQGTPATQQAFRDIPRISTRSEMRETEKRRSAGPQDGFLMKALQAVWREKMWRAEQDELPRRALAATAREPADFFDSGKAQERVTLDALGQYPIALLSQSASLTNFLPFKAVTETSEDQTIVVVGQDTAVLAPADWPLRAKSAVLLTQYLQNCSAVAGTLTLANGKELVLLAHYEQRDFTRTLAILEWLYRNAKITKAQWIVFPNPAESSREDLKRISASFNDFRARYPNFEFRLEPSKHYGRAVTLTVSGNERWIHSWQPSQNTSLQQGRVDFSKETKPTLSKAFPTREAAGESGDIRRAEMRQPSTALFKGETVREAPTQEDNKDSVSRLLRELFFDAELTLTLDWNHLSWKKPVSEEVIHRLSGEVGRHSKSAFFPFGIEHELKSWNVEKMIWELLKNASDAYSNADTQGKVFFNISRSGKDLVFDVSDNGIGYGNESPKRQPWELQRFKFSRDGSGLLMIREIVQAQGGKLEILSPGAGGHKTTVRIILPEASLSQKIERRHRAIAGRSEMREEKGELLRDLSLPFNFAKFFPGITLMTPSNHDSSNGGFREIGVTKDSGPIFDRWPLWRLFEITVNELLALASLPGYREHFTREVITNYLSKTMHSFMYRADWSFAEKGPVKFWSRFDVLSERFLAAGFGTELAAAIIEGWAQSAEKGRNDSIGGRLERALTLKESYGLSKKEVNALLALARGNIQPGAGSDAVTDLEPKIPSYEEQLVTRNIYGSLGENQRKEYLRRISTLQEKPLKVWIEKQLKAWLEAKFEKDLEAWQKGNRKEKPDESVIQKARVRGIYLTGSYPFGFREQANDIDFVVLIDGADSILETAERRELDAAVSDGSPYSNAVKWADVTFVSLDRLKGSADYAAQIYSSGIAFQGEGLSDIPFSSSEASVPTLRLMQWYVAYRLLERAIYFVNQEKLAKKSDGEYETPAKSRSIWRYKAIRRLFEANLLIRAIAPKAALGDAFVQENIALWERYDRGELDDATMKGLMASFCIKVGRALRDAKIHLIAQVLGSKKLETEVGADPEAQLLQFVSSTEVIKSFVDIGWNYLKDTFWAAQHSPELMFKLDAGFWDLDNRAKLAFFKFFLNMISEETTGPERIREIMGHFTKKAALNVDEVGGLTALEKIRLMDTADFLSKAGISPEKLGEFDRFFDIVAQHVRSRLPEGAALTPGARVHMLTAALSAMRYSDPELVEAVLSVKIRQKERDGDRLSGEEAAAYLRELVRSEEFGDEVRKQDKLKQPDAVRAEGVGKGRSEMREGEEAIASILKYGPLDAALLKLLEQMARHDEPTLWHMARVTELGVATAGAMGFAIMPAIVHSFAFHDIGKLDVPVEILNKSSRLDREEWLIKAKHPESGALMLEFLMKKLAYLREVAGNIRAHHEKQDGSGYPDGLKDAEIPLGARIMAVVDSFDAMTHKKAYYAQTYTPLEALQRISQFSGTLFDPTVLAVFFKLMKFDPVTRSFLSGESSAEQDDRPELRSEMPFDALSLAQGKRVKEGEEVEVLDLSKAELRRRSEMRETVDWLKTVEWPDPEGTGRMMSDAARAQAATEAEKGAAAFRSIERKIGYLDQLIRIAAGLDRRTAIWGEGYPDQKRTWKFWCEHSLIDSLSGVQGAVELLLEFDVNSERVLGEIRNGLKQVGAVLGQHEELAGEIQHDFKNYPQYGKASYPGKGNSAANPLTKLEQMYFFPYKVFIESPNKARNRAIFVEAVRRMSGAFDELKRSIEAQLAIHGTEQTPAVPAPGKGPVVTRSEARPSVGAERFDHYFMTEGLAEYPALKELFTEEIRQVLLEDRALKPVFMVVMPAKDLDGTLEEIDPAAVQALGGTEFFNHHSVFMASRDPAVVDAMLRQGQKIVVGVTDRSSEKTLMPILVANLRTVYFPLPDGTWLGIKGAGQLFGGQEARDTQIHFWNGLAGRYEGLLTEESIGFGRKYFHALDNRQRDFIELLAVRGLRSLPDGKGGFQPVSELREGEDGNTLEARLLFYRTLTPHRWVKLPQLLQHDPRLEKFRTRLSTTLAGLGMFPSGKVLSPSELILMNAEKMGRQEALKQNAGVRKNTLHSQDVTLAGEETDLTSLRALKGGLNVDQVTVKAGVLGSIFRGMDILSRKEFFRDPESVIRTFFNAYFGSLEKKYLDLWTAADPQADAAGRSPVSKFANETLIQPFFHASCPGPYVLPRTWEARAALEDSPESAFLKKHMIATVRSWAVAELHRRAEMRIAEEQVFSSEEVRVIEQRRNLLKEVYPSLTLKEKQAILHPHVLPVLLGVKAAYVFFETSHGKDPEPEPETVRRVIGLLSQRGESLGLVLSDHYVVNLSRFRERLQKEGSFLVDAGVLTQAQLQRFSSAPAEQSLIQDLTRWFEHYVQPTSGRSFVHGFTIGFPLADIRFEQFYANHPGRVTFLPGLSVLQRSWTGFPLRDAKLAFLSDGSNRDGASPFGYAVMSAYGHPVSFESLEKAADQTTQWESVTHETYRQWTGFPDFEKAMPPVTLNTFRSLEQAQGNRSEMREGIKAVSGRTIDRDRAVMVFCDVHGVILQPVWEIQFAEAYRRIKGQDAIREGRQWVRDNYQKDLAAELALFPGQTADSVRKILDQVANDTEEVRYPKPVPEFVEFLDMLRSMKIPIVLTSGSRLGGARVVEQLQKAGLQRLLDDAVFLGRDEMKHYVLEEDYKADTRDRAIQTIQRDYFPGFSSLYFTDSADGIRGTVKAGGLAFGISSAGDADARNDRSQALASVGADFIVEKPEAFGDIPALLGLPRELQREFDSGLEPLRQLLPRLPERAASIKAELAAIKAAATKYRKPSFVGTLSIVRPIRHSLRAADEFDPYFGQSSPQGLTGYVARARPHPYLYGEERQRIREFYLERIPPKAKVLDLMSGARTHLEPGASEVAGVGLNAYELYSNPKLSAFLTQDLNQDPKLPEVWAEHFDAVTMSSGMAYLQDPASVFKAAAKVLKPEGLLLVAYDNHFNEYVLPEWERLNSVDARLAYTREAIERSGAFEIVSYENFPGFLTGVVARKKPVADKVFGSSDVGKKETLTELRLEPEAFATIKTVKEGLLDERTPFIVVSKMESAERGAFFVMNDEVLGGAVFYDLDREREELKIEQFSTAEQVYGWKFYHMPLYLLRTAVAVSLKDTVTRGAVSVRLTGKAGDGAMPEFDGISPDLLERQPAGERVTEWRVPRESAEKFLQAADKILQDPAVRSEMRDISKSEAGIVQKIAAYKDRPVPGAATLRELAAFADGLRKDEPRALALAYQNVLARFREGELLSWDPVQLFTEDWISGDVLPSKLQLLTLYLQFLEKPEATTDLEDFPFQALRDSAMEVMILWEVNRRLINPATAKAFTSAYRSLPPVPRSEMRGPETTPGVHPRGDLGLQDRNILSEKEFQKTPYAKWAPWIRVFDIVGAIVLLPALLLVTLVLAPLIKLSSPGPVFYTQWRPGYQWELKNPEKNLFRIYKFRTMPESEDKTPTRLGRFLRHAAIDELPQILNILKGEMSFVGPRPLPVQEMGIYEPYAGVFHTRKPGGCSLFMRERGFGKGIPTVDELKKAVFLNNREIKQWSLALMIHIVGGTALEILRVIWKSVLRRFPSAVKEIALFDSHEKANDHILGAIAGGKIPAGLPVFLFDLHSDNVDEPLYEGSWVTWLRNAAGKVGDIFWIHPRDRKILMNEIAKTFKAQGSDLETILKNAPAEIFRRGVILSFDLDYFVSTDRPDRPLPGEIAEKIAGILKLFEKYGIPVKLINGAYSAPQYAPLEFKNEFRDAISKGIERRDGSIYAAPRKFSKEAVEAPEVAQIQGRRASQEDRYVNEKVKVAIPGWAMIEGQMMAVMDGHDGSTVADLIRVFLVPIFKLVAIGCRGDIDAALKKTYRVLHGLTAWSGSGSTLSLAFVPQDKKVLYVMTVGDSPVYILKDGDFRSFQEHSVGEDPKMRSVPGFEVETKNGHTFLMDSVTGRATSLTRFFGDRHFGKIRVLEPYVVAIDLSGAKNVEVVLASDGIHGKAWNPSKDRRDDRIRGLALRQASASDYLTYASREQAPDNVTVLRMKFSTPQSDRPSPSERDSRLETSEAAPLKVLQTVSLSKADLIQNPAAGQAFFERFDALLKDPGLAGLHGEGKTYDFIDKYSYARVFSDAKFISFCLTEMSKNIAEHVKKDQPAADYRIVVEQVEEASGRSGVRVITSDTGGGVAIPYIFDHPKIRDDSVDMDATAMRGIFLGSLREWAWKEEGLLLEAASRGKGVRYYRDGTGKHTEEFIPENQDTTFAVTVFEPKRSERPLARIDPGTSSVLPGSARSEMRKDAQGEEGPPRPPEFRGMFGVVKPVQVEKARIPRKELQETFRKLLESVDRTKWKVWIGRMKINGEESWLVYDPTRTFPRQFGSLQILGEDHSPRFDILTATRYGTGEIFFRVGPASQRSEMRSFSPTPLRVGYEGTELRQPETTPGVHPRGDLGQGGGMTLRAYFLKNHTNLRENPLQILDDGGENEGLVKAAELLLKTVRENPALQPDPEETGVLFRIFLSPRASLDYEWRKNLQSAMVELIRHNAGFYGEFLSLLISEKDMRSIITLEGLFKAAVRGKALPAPMTREAVLHLKEKFLARMHLDESWAIDLLDTIYSHEPQLTPDEEDLRLFVTGLSSAFFHERARLYLRKAAPEVLVPLLASEGMPDPTQAPKLPVSGMIDPEGLAAALQVEDVQLFNLVFNPENVRKLLPIATLLRTLYPYDEIKDREPMEGLLEYAVRKHLYFPLGSGLFITPVTDSHRRHIVFRMGADGTPSRAIEIKIPGDIPDERHRVVHKDDVEVPAEIRRRWPKAQIVRGIGFLSLPEGVYEIYKEKVRFGPRESDNTSCNIAVFEYRKDRDGPRVTNLSEKEILAIAQKYERYRGDPKEVLRDIAHQAYEVLAMLHTLGYTGTSQTGTDAHMENYRAVFGEKGLESESVADLLGFSHEHDSADRDVAFLANGVGGRMFVKGLSNLLEKGGLSQEECEKIYQEEMAFLIHEEQGRSTRSEIRLTPGASGISRDSLEALWKSALRAVRHKAGKKFTPTDHANFRYAVARGVAGLLAAQDVRLTRIWLFGSVAAGDVENIGPQSDIDLVLEVTSDAGKKEVVALVEAVDQVLVEKMNGYFHYEEQPMPHLLDVVGKVLLKKEIASGQGFAAAVQSIRTPPTLLFERGASKARSKMPLKSDASGTSSALLGNKRSEMRLDIPKEAIVVAGRLGQVIDTRKLVLDLGQIEALAREIVVLEGEVLRNPAFEKAADWIPRLKNKSHVLLLRDAQDVLTGVIWAWTPAGESFSKWQRLVIKKDGVRGKAHFLADAYLSQAFKSGNTKILGGIYAGESDLSGFLDEYLKRGEKEKFFRRGLVSGREFIFQLRADPLDPSRAKDSYWYERSDAGERKTTKPLSPEELNVARLAQDVFAFMRVSRSELRQVLASLDPVAYAMNRSEARVKIETLLTDPVKLESGTEQVAVIFKAIPQPGDPVLQMLVDVIAKSRFLRFQIAVPGASRAELGVFKEMLVREVNQARPVKGRVNLDVVSDEMKISKFVGEYSANALVYDMREGEEALAKIVAEVGKAKAAKETLFVYNDRALPLSQRSFALLAAINSLLEKHIPKDRKIQKGSDVLRVFAENLRIAAAAEQSILQSA